jgi:hypothetical protein
MTERSAARPSGQIVVIFAVALIAIALTVGLVVDGGMAFLQRRDGQNDADLAALAGTKVIADAWIDRSATPRSAVYQAIQQRLTLSGCTLGGASPCSWTARLIGPGQADLGQLTAGGGGSVDGSSPAILGIRVDVTSRPRTFFLGLVGQGAWRVITSATALTARPSRAPAGQLLPIALHAPSVPFEKGQIYDLTPDKVAPGGFAWVDWRSTGRNAVADSTCIPDNPALGLTGNGTTVNRAPSDSDWSRVRNCLEKWRATGATVLIPIYAADSKPPAYRIVGVAAFVIRSIDEPDDGDIQAYFVGTFAYPSVPVGSDQPPQPTDSLFYLGLVK